MNHLSKHTETEYLNNIKKINKGKKQNEAIKDRVISYIKKVFELD